MSIYGRSRYIKVPMTQTKTADGEYIRTYDVRQTTVRETDLPEEDTEWYSVRQNETFESICEREYPSLGGAEIWWVLADCNPHIFYPLDISAGDRIKLPPPYWIQQYLNEIDDWERTWENVTRL